MFYHCRQTIKNNECDESPLRVYNLHALSAASLWVAIKFAAPRECLPGTSFMSMVVGKQPILNPYVVIIFLPI